MRESKEYERAKFHGTTIESEVYYDKGFVEGYENCYETHKPFLEWQKPEDVELENGKTYLIKINDTSAESEVYSAMYEASKKEFCLHTFWTEPMFYELHEVLIKQIEV